MAELSSGDRDYWRQTTTSSGGLVLVGWGRLGGLSAAFARSEKASVEASLLLVACCLCCCCCCGAGAISCQMDHASELLTRGALETKTGCRGKRSDAICASRQVSTAIATTSTARLCAACDTAPIIVLLICPSVQLCFCLRRACTDRLALDYSRSAIWGSRG